MKKYFATLFCSLITGFTTFAQTNYELFQINEKYGIVNKHTLQEQEPPIFTSDYSHKFLNHFALSLFDSMHLFDKNSGIAQQYAGVFNDLFVDTRTGTAMHIVQNNKSALLMTQTMEIFQAKYLYKKMYGMNWKILAQRDGYFDLLGVGSNLPIQKSIAATNLYAYYFLYEDKLIYILYGGASSYFYDSKGELLKVVKQKASNEATANQLLLQHFKEVPTKIMVEPAIGVDEWRGWVLKKQKDGFNYYLYSYNRKPYYIRTNESTQHENTFEYENAVKFFNKSLNKSYKFKLDDAQLEALLPLQYQSEMDFRMVKWIMNPIEN